jgi:hypothetical protein
VGGIKGLVLYDGGSSMEVAPETQLLHQITYGEHRNTPPEQSRMIRDNNGDNDDCITRTIDGHQSDTSDDANMHML